MKKDRMIFKSLAFSWKLVFSSRKGLIFLYLALKLVTATFPLLTAFCLKYVLDALTEDEPEIEKVMAVTIVYGLTLVAYQGVSSAAVLTRKAIEQKARHLFEVRFLEKLSSLPMEILDSSEGRDMIDHVGYMKYDAVLLTLRVADTLSEFYSFAVAFATLALFSLWFSFLFLAVTVPGILLADRYARKTDAFREEKAPDVRKFHYYRWMLTDAWPAKDVRMYDLTEPIKTRYKEERDKYVKANKALDKKVLHGMLGIKLFCRSGGGAFVAYTAASAARGRIGVGDAALIVGFIKTAYDSFWQITALFADMFGRLSERMGKLLAFFSIRTDRERGRRKLTSFDSLVFDRVSFKYPHGEKNVLNGVSFALNRGEKLSIVGINGSGKTTIIKLMLGLYEITSGQILLNGHPYLDYDIRDVRKLFSVLFQSFVQYPLTLRENVALSSLEKMGENAEIESALEKSGIYGELKLIDGLDSFMTRRFSDDGIELSKGQWQKIALSRAYFKGAPITVFDEPSAALDAEAEDRIFRNFASLSEKSTGIMISHRISCARLSTKIIVLDGGRIVEEGTHDELIRENGLYAKLYNLQRQKYTAEGVG